jgi:NitT/TauT family transport system ATP-binding protein
MPLVALNQVSYAYGQQEVLRAVDFTIVPGDFMRLLAGLTQPTAGTITLDGAPIGGPGLDRSVVFQDYSLFPWLTAGQNVVLALEQAFPDKSRTEQEETARKYLELVGLGDVFHKLPKALSGGMRQRAAIARAFAINSPLLLMDEPFGALDAITRARLQDLLLQLWHQNGQERKTVVFVTHDVEEAILLANRAVVLGTNPGTVRGIFDIPIPHPRRRKELYKNPKFVALRERLVGELHADVLDGLDIPIQVRSAGEGI